MYLDLARQYGVAITHVFETRIQLQRRGFTRVRNVIGSGQAWMAADYETESRAG